MATPKSRGFREKLGRLWLQERRSILSALFAVWLLVYIPSVKRIKVHLSGSSRQNEKDLARMAAIIAHCPSLAKVYWPTVYAPTALLQFALLGLKEFRARLLQKSPYRRELLSLKDGAVLALDWVPAADGFHGTLPVCILLHGAFQDSASVTMSDLARSLARRGMPAVVMNRRGYGGVDPSLQKVAMFGSDEDLDEVVAAIAKQEPQRPVAIIGFSCGSGFSGRYVGNRSVISVWPMSANGSGGSSLGGRILCGVMYDPGYDVSPEGAVALVRWPYSWVVNWSIKYFYAFRHRQALLTNSPKAAREGFLEMLSPTSGTVDTYRSARRLSGMYKTQGDSSAWLEAQQPRINSVQIPSILVNSRDDPICRWENVEANLREINSNANLALVELQRGAHGCKFGFWGFGSIIEPIIGEFVQASWEELGEALKQANGSLPRT